VVPACFDKLGMSGVGKGVLELPHDALAVKKSTMKTTAADLDKC
jgi:hypothetical protein